MQRNRYLYATVLWAVVILVIAIIPGNEISKINQSFTIAKLAHLGEFFIFGWLLSKSVPNLKNQVNIALFWAAFTESLQIYVPGRSFEYADIALNAFGALFAIYRYQYMVAKPIKRVVR